MKTKLTISNTLMILMFSLLAMSSCSKQNADIANLKIEIPPLSSYYSGLSSHDQHSILLKDVKIMGGGDTSYVPYAPANVSGFDCLLVNVVGAGIGDWDTNSSRVGNGDKFSYIGTFSKLVSVVTGGTIEVKVKKGSKRFIQLLGVKSTIGCPASATKDDLNNVTKFPGIFIVGKIQKDVIKDGEVTVNNTYNPTTCNDIRGSESQPVPSNADTTAPTLTTGALTPGTISSNSIEVKWTAASDVGTLASQLKYKVVRASAGSDISSIVLANAATTAMNWTAGVTAATIDGLSAETTYEFVVLVKDYNSNVSIYTQTPFTTSAEGGGEGTKYTVTYNGNTNDSGTVPVDSTAYSSGAEVTVANNSGTLAKAGNTFSGWNTQSNGDGTDYAVGAKFHINANTTLYAKWVINSTKYNVSYNSNFGVLSGTGVAPNDSTDYSNGQSVNILGSGTMAVTGYVFNGWNTQADGGGTSYLQNDSFTISSNTTLYAIWARQVHVSNDHGNDTTGDGSTAKPYKTIAKALSTFNATEGGEIRVATTETSYTISSSISLKSNIRLRGGFSEGETWTQNLANKSKLSNSGTEAFTFIDISSLSGNQLVEGFLIDEPSSRDGNVVGINISSSPNTIVNYNTIKVDSSTGSYGVKISGSTQVEINGNFINPMNQGSFPTTAAAGIHFSTLNTGSKIKLYNNVVDVSPKAEGSNSTPLAVQILNNSNITLTAKIRNNTFHASYRNGEGTNPYAFGFESSSAATMNLSFDNNIVFSDSTKKSEASIGVYCQVNCTIVSLKNNDFYKLSSFLTQSNNPDNETVAALNALTNASGNISTAVNFEEGLGNYHLNETANASIKTGGLDGVSLSWGFTNDADGVTRSGSSGTGWSMGAYEQDL